MTSEAAILSNVVDKTRQLTKMYLDLLKDADPYKVFELEGKKLNSAFWIMAHLSVTENFLLLRSTGGESVKIPWARNFGLGSVPPAKEDCPPKEEVISFFSDIHERALRHISTLDSDFLNQQNSTGFEFLGEKTVRSAIIHSIRHEGSHAGHLGWLCKLNGIKTI